MKQQPTPTPPLPRAPVRRWRHHLIAGALAVFPLACTTAPPDSTAFATDTGVKDAGVVDAGSPDVGTPDVGTLDAGSPDTGTPDVGPPDAGIPDAGPPDAGIPDAGVPDAGPHDTGTPDVGIPDAGPPDTSGCATPKDCDDGKTCTIDLCNTSDGTCTHKPHTGSCDDGDPCTLADSCKSGTCKGTLPRYFRREIPVKPPIPGAALAVSGGQVALASGSDGHPALYGLDNSGLLTWTAKPAGTNTEGGLRAVRAHDAGSFVTAGWVVKPGSKAHELFFAHVGATGSVIKTGKVALVASEAAVEGLAASGKSGHVAFAGRKVVGDSTFAALYGTYNVVQGSLAGNMTTLSGGSGTGRAAYGLVAAGSNHVVFGWAGPPNKYGRDAWLYALDQKTGFKVFEVTFGKKSTDEIFYGAAVMADAGLLAGGMTTWNDNASKTPNAFLVRTDKTGKELWSRRFGTDAEDTLQAVLPNAGGAMLIGLSAEKSGVQGLGTLWQVDSWGNVVWQRSHNLSGRERLISALSTPAGVWIAGWQSTAAQQKLIVMRTDRFGHASCGQSGLCAGKQSCDDAKVCTADDCEAGKGCVHPPMILGAPCGTGQTCTATATCK